MLGISLAGTAKACPPSHLIRVLPVVCVLLTQYVPRRPRPVPTNEEFCEITVLGDIPAPNILCVTNISPACEAVTVSILPDIDPSKSAATIEGVVGILVVVLPVMVGAPVEDTAVYL
jgi:hypothetical protein